MKFVSFEDTTGLYETVFFPKVYNRYCHMLNGARPYILKGKVEEDFGAVNVTVYWIDSFWKRRHRPARTAHGLRRMAHMVITLGIVKAGRLHGKRKNYEVIKVQPSGKAFWLEDGE